MKHPENSKITFPLFGVWQTGRRHAKPKHERQSKSSPIAPLHRRRRNGQQKTPSIPTTIVNMSQSLPTTRFRSHAHAARLGNGNARRLSPCHQNSPRALDRQKQRVRGHRKNRPVPICRTLPRSRSERNFPATESSRPRRRPSRRGFSMRLLRSPPLGPAVGPALNAIPEVAERAARKNRPNSRAPFR